MSKKTNTNQRGGASPWQFMEASDKRREVWQQYEACDITPVDLPCAIETYYLKLRKAGIVRRWCGSCVGERRTQNGVITNVVADDGQLDDFDTYLLFCLIEEISSAQDILGAYLTYKTCFDFIPPNIRKDVFYILLLEGINESLNTPDPFIFETEIDLVRGFVASCPNEEERKTLFPFLDFLAKTEAGKKVQDELIGDTETVQKDALINYVCHPDTQRVNDELCAYIKGMQGQKLADVVRLCITWKILNRNPPFDVLKDAGAKGTEGAYKRAMSRIKNFDVNMVKVVERIARR